MGILEIFSDKPNPQLAVDYFSKSFSGMIEDDRYEGTEFVEWNRMLLSVSYLETLEEAEFEHASRLYSDAIKSNVSFPYFLHEKVLETASASDHLEFIETISDEILNRFKTEAMTSFLRLEVWKKSARIRSLCLNYISTAKMSAVKKWSKSEKLLESSMNEGKWDQAEEILDHMQTLAAKVVKLLKFSEIFSRSRSTMSQYGVSRRQTLLVWKLLKGLELWKKRVKSCTVYFTNFGWMKGMFLELTQKRFLIGLLL